MKILLTGCAGFIGSHVLDRLLQEDHQVVGVDNFDPDYDRELKERNIAKHLVNESSSNFDDPPTEGGASFQLLEADLADESTYVRLEEHFADKFDAIIHLAAKGGTRSSVNEPISYLRANVVGTEKLLKYAKKKGISHVVFASSSSIYGANPKVPWREEIAEASPISPYANTKLCCEHLGQSYSKLYGIRFVALRFFAVYGPRQRPDLVIHKFAKLIYDGAPLTIYGDGDSSPDYTYIDDIVEGVIGGLHYRNSLYEIINLGNNQRVKLQAMIEQLEYTFATKAEVERHPEQEGDAPHTWANVEKAKSLVGYVPKTSFEDGIYLFAEWFIREHSRQY